MCALIVCSNARSDCRVSHQHLNFRAGPITLTFRSVYVVRITVSAEVDSRIMTDRALEPSGRAAVGRGLF